MKLIFLDCETGGLNKSKDALLQLSGIVEIDGVVKEDFDYYINPEGKNVSEDALRVQNRDLSFFAGADSSKVVYRAFTTMLSHYVNKFDKRDKFTLIGYNAAFDDGFLRQFFKDNGDNYYGSYFHWPALDVAQIAMWEFLDARDQFENFKLSTLYQFCFPNAEVSGVHDANFDVKITREIFQFFRERKLHK